VRCASARPASVALVRHYDADERFALLAQAIYAVLKELAHLGRGIGYECLGALEGVYRRVIGRLLAFLLLARAFRGPLLGRFSVVLVGCRRERRERLLAHGGQLVTVVLGPVGVLRLDE